MVLISSEYVPSHFLDTLGCSAGGGGGGARTTPADPAPPPPRSGVKHRVHRANLLSASKVWRDLFEIGSAGEEVPEITMDEDNKTLEWLLQFLYPEPVTLPAPKLPRDWPLVCALDKFEVRTRRARGVRVAAGAELATVLFGAALARDRGVQG